MLANVTLSLITPTVFEFAAQAGEEKEEARDARESDVDYSKAKVNPENLQQIVKNNKPVVNLDGSKLQSHQDNDMELLSKKHM